MVGLPLVYRVNLFELCFPVRIRVSLHFEQLRYALGSCVCIGMLIKHPLSTCKWLNVAMHVCVCRSCCLENIADPSVSVFTARGQPSTVPASCSLCLH